jgi:hypothetical protein
MLNEIGSETSSDNFASAGKNTGKNGNNSINVRICIDNGSRKKLSFETFITVCINFNSLLANIEPAEISFFLISGCSIKSEMMISTRNLCETCFYRDSPLAYFYGGSDILLFLKSCFKVMIKKSGLLHLCHFKITEYFYLFKINQDYKKIFKSELFFGST